MRPDPDGKMVDCPELAACNGWTAEVSTFITTLVYETERVMTGLEYYRDYTFTVTVKNEFGMLGPESDPTDVVKTLSTKPTPPGELYNDMFEWQPDIWKYRLLLHWLEPYCDGGRPFTGYKFQVKEVLKEETEEEKAALAADWRKRRKKKASKGPQWQNVSVIDFIFGQEKPFAYERAYTSTMLLHTQAHIMANASMGLVVRVKAITDGDEGEWSEPTETIVVPCPRAAPGKEPNCSLPANGPPAYLLE